MTNEHPFASVPSARLIVTTDARRAALARLDEGLGTREPFLLVTGDPGTGKTTLVQEAIAGWGARATVAILTHLALSRAELIEEIARRFGVEPPAGSSIPQLLAGLERALALVAGRGQVAVIVVEDAHEVEPELLEELRVLVNAEAQAHRPLEVVLVGPPTLDARLTTPALVWIRQRVALHCHLEPLSPKETRHYLHHRVSAVGGNGAVLFPKKTCAEIHSRARGIPRAINTLAGEAMRRARDAGVHVVSPDHVRAAAGTLWTGTATRETPPEPNASADLERSSPPTAATDSVLLAEPAPSTSPGAPAASPTGGSRDEPSEATADDPAHHDDETADATASAIPHQDPRVREWVTRFIGDQGPPRFGVRLRAESLEEAARIALARGEGLDETTDTDDATGETIDSVPSAGRERAPRGRSRSPHAPRGHRPSLPRGFTTAAVLAVAAAGAFLMWPRMSRIPLRWPAANVAVKTRRPADRPVAATASLGPSAVTPVDSPPAATAASRSKRTAGAASTSAPSPVDSTAAIDHQHRATIQVGSFSDAPSAEFERDRLYAETGLETWVIAPETDGGAFSVVLGIYRSEDRAQMSLATLIARGVVSEARVVPLPPKRRRR